MKVAGFTFIRNAVKFDYPIKEAILSVLPLCDEFVVCLGDSDDETEPLIRSIGDPRIRIIHSVWDDSLRQGGHVLSVETDKALDAVSPDCDWAFYIQADEILHEKYLIPVRNSMEKWLKMPEVEGLLFDYLHFYATYDFVGDSRRWYRNEIRIIRNDKSIRSWKDAQGFRKEGRKLKVKKADAAIFHYGWVKPPDKQQEKQKFFHRLWHSDDKVKAMTGESSVFDYSRVDSLKRFSGTHPAVMEERISNVGWAFSYDVREKNLSLKNSFLQGLERLTGKRFFEYRNFELIP
jgi:hypothetical protein